jgi:alpha-N-arabinofuranosidase
LSGTASVNGKQLTLTVTNPHMSEKRETEIVVRGARIASAAARVLSTGDVHAHNTFENPRAVEPHSETVTVKNDTLVFNFAPASVTLLQLNLL